MRRFGVAGNYRTAQPPTVVEDVDRLGRKWTDVGVLQHLPGVVPWSALTRLEPAGVAVDVPVAARHAIQREPTVAVDEAVVPDAKIEGMPLRLDRIVPDPDELVVVNLDPVIPTRHLG